MTNYLEKLQSYITKDTRKIQEYTIPLEEFRVVLIEIIKDKTGIYLDSNKDFTVIRDHDTNTAYFCINEDSFESEEDINKLSQIAHIDEWFLYMESLLFTLTNTNYSYAYFKNNKTIILRIDKK